MLITQSELIALNRATTYKQYSFSLNGTALKFAPDGWSDDEYTMQRDMKLFGVFRKFAASELKFVKDGRDILETIYESDGVNAVCNFTVNELLSTGATRNRFVGYIDFSTYKITEISVDVAVIDGSFTDLILSRSKVDVNVQGSKSIDGIDLGELPLTTVTIPEIKIHQIANLEWDKATLPYTTTHNLPVLVINTEYTEIVSGSSVFFNTALAEYLSTTLKIKLNAISVGTSYATHYTWTFHVERWAGGVFVENVYTNFYDGYGTDPLTISIDDSTVFDINEGDSFKITMNLTSAAETILMNYSAISLHIECLIESLPSSQIDVLLYHEAFDRVIAHYCGQAGRFKSDFFGRTDIGGVLGSITTGRHIRGQMGLNTTIPYSLETLFSSLQAIYCLGMGIEIIDGVEKVVIEPMAHFFNNQIILDVSNRIAPETIEKQYYPELAFNRISVGYNSFDYRALGGVYEYNSTSKFTTVISPVDKELNIVSPYRADMSGVLALIKEPTENKDVSGESDIFILDTVRKEGGYIVRSVEDFEQSEDLSNMDILINLAISPKRNLLRWGSYLRGFLEKYLTSLIIWQTSDKNTKLSSTETGQSTITENSDIVVSDLADPLWHPETFDIEVPIKETDIDYINANPYGIVKISATEFGWILNYKSKNENRKSTFRLLRVNTSYVTPGEVPVVPPITSLTINLTINNALTDDTYFVVKIIKNYGSPIIYSIQQGVPVIINQIGYGNYTIELIQNDGYNLVSTTPETFIIGADNLDQVVEIVNSKSGEGTITITKSISGYPDDETFFHVTITGQRSVDPEEYDGYVSQQEPLVFFGVAFDTYVITEDETSGYELASALVPIVLDSDTPDVTVNVANERLQIKYGALYNWYAANDIRGFAPLGFRVPTDMDHDIFALHFSNSVLAGNQLRSIGTEFWAVDSGSTNELHFNAKGAGERDCSDGSFDSLKGALYLGLGDYKPGGTIWKMLAITPGHLTRRIWAWNQPAIMQRLGTSYRFIKETLSESDLLKSDGEYCDPVSDFDGNIYKTVKIGDQVWTAENWACTKLADGTPIPNVTDNTEWAALTTGAMCYYDNDINNA